MKSASLEGSTHAYARLISYEAEGEGQARAEAESLQLRPGKASQRKTPK